MILKRCDFTPKFMRFLTKKSVLIIVAAILFTPVYAHLYAQSSQWEWEGVDRVVAIGDVHGSYEKLVALLHGMELVDDQLAWIGGKDHLVFCGDLIDRGPDDRPVMDLIIRLRSEASAQGGRVHVVLGNHDVLNLVRDTRYIHAKGFSDFASEELKEDREKAWKAFKALHARKGIQEDKVKAAFDDKYPPGFFARLKAFEAEGQYGSWLLTLPAVIKINNVLFVHGGLTPEVASVGIEGINRRVHDSLVEFMTNSKYIERLIKEPATFQEITETSFRVDNRTYRGNTSSRQKRAAKSIIKLIDSYLFSPDGPLWYRGNSLDDELVLSYNINKIFPQLKAHSLVVAHTPTDSGRIITRNNHTIVRSDVGMAYGREPFAVVFKDEAWKEFDPKTLSYMKPSPEIYTGEKWFKIQEQLSDRQLEDYLRKAKVTKIMNMKTLQDGRPFGLVELDRDKLNLHAVFQAVDENTKKSSGNQHHRRRSYKYEVASYLIDRQLGQAMVPVTVERKIEGKNGSFQIYLESVKTWRWVEEHGQKERILKEYKEAVDKAYVFAALLDVEERAPGAIIFLPLEKRIMLADNTKAFSLSPTVQERFLPELHCPIDPELDLALRELEFKGLEKLVGKFLSKAQIHALLQRRDQILQLCAGDNN